MYSSQKRSVYDEINEHFEMSSKRQKLGINFIEPTQNFVRKHFPNPLQIDLNVIDELIWKLNDPFIFKQCCRIADVCIPLARTYEFSSSPPIDFPHQVGPPSGFFYEERMPNYSPVSSVNKEPEYSNQGKNCYSFFFITAF